ncbi:MAG: amidohydrolase family protein, partial [Clostridia bacterium]|nr:amidohydrolase family protein [Clostridia bacterium]
MKIFDMHIHSRPDAQPNPKALLKEMENTGVYGGCVFSNHPIEGTEPGGSDFETRLNEVLAWSKGYEDRIFPVLWIHPHEKNLIENVRKAADAGIVAFKMICEDFYVYDEPCMTVLREIAKLGKPVIFHTGILWDGAVSSNYNRPLNWEHLLDIDGLKFSMGHCSWPWIDECVALYGKFLNALKDGKSAEMFFDITPGTPEIYRKELFTKLYYAGYNSGDNIIFGTDSNSVGYRAEWVGGWLSIDGKILDELGVSLENREKLYNKNLMRFLGKDTATAEKEAPVPDNTHVWSPENPEAKEIVKKWYTKLGFPKVYDKEFFSALDRIKVTDALTIDTYDKKCEDGKKNLIYYLFFCEELSKKYAEKNIPESILIDTLKDLVVWTNTWTCVKGTLHLSELNWLSRHLSMKLFKIGRLQFCFGKAEEDIPEFNVLCGDNVMEIHIQGEGKLDAEECKK